MSRFRTLVSYSVLALSVLTLVECLSYAAGLKLARRGVFYLPEIIIEDRDQLAERFVEYQKKKDPVLGWPPPQLFGARESGYDKRGARSISSGAFQATSCVSLYGDSFTWGTGVISEHSRGYILSQKLDCDISNFGVEGYGTDQALLRFQQNKEDHSPIVILGHASADILRNVNQYRMLLYPDESNLFGLKPRFILSRSDGIELVALPDFSEQEFLDLLIHPEQYLNHEYFIPNGPSGKKRLRFPYFLSVLKGLEYFHVREWMLKRPRYSGFYEVRHPSGALELTIRIIERFCAEAYLRNQEPLVLLFPTGQDLSYYRCKKRWVYEPLVHELARRNVRFLNLGPGLLEGVGPSAASGIFRPPDSHLNEEGNELVAQIVHEYLLSNLAPRLDTKGGKTPSDTAQGRARVP